MEEEKLIKLQKDIKYLFINTNLLKIALTHKSYAYEKKQTDPKYYNERLEYLGDAILEHVISEYLFNYRPILTEGQMTKKRASIVCEKTLARAIKKIKIEKYIYLGKCEKTTNGQAKDAILADVFEAMIGAIYVDGGYETAKIVCLELLDEYIQNVLVGNELEEDYKTKLQEKLQVNGNVKIEYILKEDKGPDHDKTFFVEVFVNGEKIGEGSGKNKKSAEQASAKYALESEK
ncbi:MAG: ribonuclease III [Clostridia bacterium]|nr:ribonuclease III [Clostridia bacterium]